MLGAYTVTLGTLAQVMQVPEIYCNEVQRRQLAEASANVLRHFDMAISPLAYDCSVLLLTAGTIAFSQSMAYHARKQHEQNAGAQPTRPFPVSFGSNPLNGERTVN